MRPHAPLVLLLGTALAASPAAAGLQVREIDSPAGPGSGEPFLAADGDTVWMTWFEGPALLLSRLEGEDWSEPRRVARDRPFFVNWADFPSLRPLAGGRLAVHWPEKSAEDTYAYDVLVAFSDDRGRTWSEPVRPHRDGTPTEHGFVSLLDLGPDGLGAVWLDGRDFHGEEAGREMAVRFSRFADGRFGPSSVLDGRVCDCCQTAAAVAGEVLFVVYRDRSDAEVRDISYVRRVDGRWTEPRTLHEDGWRIPACPVNGPAVAVDGDRLTVAWFTGAVAGPGARSRGRTLVARSVDRGATFGPPVRFDGGSPVGRVDVTPLPGGAALISWMERTGDKRAEVRLRPMGPDGELGAPVTAAELPGGRGSGFPRLAPAGRGAVLAWTEPGEPSRVRTARIEGDPR